MTYKYKDLVVELKNIAVLYHASQALPYKILDVLEKHLQGDERVVERGCFERGCACYDSRVDEDAAVVLMTEIKK